MNNNNINDFWANFVTQISRIVINFFQFITMDRGNQFPALCKILEKISYGLGHVFNDLCAAMWFSYTLFYLQVVLQMEATTAGLLLMIGTSYRKKNDLVQLLSKLIENSLILFYFAGQVVDSLATPFAGWSIDSTGHRRLWHLGGEYLKITLLFNLFLLKQVEKRLLGIYMTTLCKYWQNAFILCC